MKPTRKRHQERRHFAGGQGLGGPERESERYKALVDFARRTKGVKWSKRLFLLLLEELYIGDEFDEIIGRPDKLPPQRYTQALAFAVALRHSWWPGDLDAIAGEVLDRHPRRHVGSG